MKPFDRQDIVFTVRKALSLSRHAAREPQATPPRASVTLQGFVGEAQAMRSVYDLLRRAAHGVATVLLRGESGTGKEVAARALHESSPRRAGPFVKVHCAALPDTLLETELFGHVKGAFTGAAYDKAGRVELAQGGTLFLDEIGDITPALQVKLLRVLQDRQFERVGGTRTVQADVRFVAATHRDLEAMVKKGDFREDLFYRLNVVPVWMPPLRQRTEDVPALARHFCALAGSANLRPGASLDPSAVALLAAQPWPGNVRQLQNFVERMVVLAPDDLITAADVQEELGRQPGFSSPPEAAVTDAPDDGATGLMESYRRESERKAITVALARAKGNRTLAARILGISRRMLQYKLNELSID
jgi:two-component system response regulator AtoC